MEAQHKMKRKHTSLIESTSGGLNANRLICLSEKHINMTGESAGAEMGTKTRI